MPDDVMTQDTTDQDTGSNQDSSAGQDSSQSGALAASQTFAPAPGALSSTQDSGPLPTPGSSQDQQTQSAPQPAPPQPDAQGMLPSDNPRLQRVAGSLWNALKGISTSVVNSEKQQINRLNTLKNNEVEESNAKVKFLNAQAAEQVARATVADKQMQSWDEEHQLAMQNQNLTNMKLAKDAGFVIRAVTPMDQGTQANTKAAMNNLEQLSPVAPMLYFHVGNQVVAMQMQDQNAGIDIVNQTRQAQGLTPYTQAQWQGLPQQVQQSLTMSAVNFNDPGLGSVTEDTLQTLQNRLANVQAQPDFNGKDALVDRLQTAVKNQTAILDAAKTRANKQKSDEAVAAANTPQGKDEHDLKRAQINNLNSEAENRQANANNNDEWKPKVTADEKKKAELAENIAYNANEVNSILARRPDLIGSIAGRYTNTKQMIGNNDPDISAIGTHIHNIAMANSGVHGFRSQEGVSETEGLLLNHFKNGATAVKGAMDANVNSVQTFIDNARPDGYRTSSKQGGAGAYYAKLSQKGDAQNDAARVHQNMKDFRFHGTKGNGTFYSDDNKTWYDQNGNLVK